MAYKLSHEQRRQRRRLRYDPVFHPHIEEFCPLCGEPMPAPDLAWEDERFCQRCETLLHWVEDRRAGRWIVAGIHSSSVL